MKRREAINIVQGARQYLTAGNPIWDAEKVDEAMKMAIDALLERPKGEWKCMADCGVTECDQCGWSIEEYVGDYNFCPMCGARMEANE